MPSWHLARTVSGLLMLQVCLLLPGVSLAQPRPPISPPGDPLPQEEAPKAAPQTLPAAPGRILPDVFVLPDEEGRLTAMPGFSLADFEAAWRAREGLDAAQPPAIHLQRLALQGKQRGTSLDCTLTLEVQLRRADLTPLPLGMSQAIWRGVQGLQPTAGEVLHFRPTQPGAGGEYLLWLQGQPGEKRTIQLTFSVPLQSAGDGQQVLLDLPRAVVSSAELVLPQAASLVSYEGSATAELVREEKQARVVSAGLIGRWNVVWTLGSGDVPTGVLRADATTTVRVGFGSIRTRYLLRLEPIGPQLRRAVVLLPPGVEVASAQAEDAIVRPVADNSSTNRPGLEVLFGQGVTGPREMLIETTQPRAATGAESVTLRGLEVAGALQQAGTVRLAGDADRRVRWLPSAELKAIDPAEGDLAAFEFSQPSWQLELTIAPQAARERMTLDHTLQLADRFATWRGELTFGAETVARGQLRLNLHGWELNRRSLETSQVVDAAAVVVESDGSLRLPLRKDATGEGTITLEARRELPEASGELRWPLPVPFDAELQEGRLVVWAHQRWLVNPLAAQVQGMDRITEATTPRPSSEFAAAPLAYRTFTPQPVFSAGVERLAPQILGESDTTSRLVTDAAEVTTRLTLAILHEPQNGIRLRVPAGVETSSVSAFLGETPLTVRPIGEGEGTELELRFPQPLMGKVEFRLRYQASSINPRVLLPSPAMTSLAGPAGASLTGGALGNWAQPTIAIPLVQPVVDEWLGGTVQATSAAGWPLAQDAADAVWQAESRGTNANSTATFSTLAQPSHLPLRALVGRELEARPTEVRQLWLQTWLNPGVRQTRAVWRVLTPRRSLTVEIPIEPRPQVLDVFVNRRAVVFLEENGRLIVPIPAASPEDALTLEVIYQQPHAGHLAVRHNMLPPRLVEAASVLTSYWQVVLPGDEHLFHSRARMTREWRWQRRGALASREPTRSTAQLEAWSGAMAASPPEVAVNSYLFSSFAAPKSLEIVVIRRTWLVALASTPLLLLGLLWLAQPSRSVKLAALLVLAVALAGVVFFSEQSLLVVQAAIPGVAILAMMAGLSARRSPRQAPEPATSRGSEFYLDGLTSRQSVRSDRSGSNPSLSPTVTLRTEAEPPAPSGS